MQWKLRVTLTLNSGWFTGSWSNRPVVLLYTICRTFIVAIGKSNSRFLEILDGMQISKDYQKDDVVYTDTGRILFYAGKRRNRYASLWCRICRLLRRMDGQSLLSTASLSGRSRWSGIIARKYLHEHLADSTRFRLFHLVLEHMAANTGLLFFKMLMWAPIDWPSSKLKWASQSVWLRNTSVKCVSIVSSPRLESWNFNQNLHVTLNRTKRGTIESCCILNWNAVVSVDVNFFRLPNNWVYFSSVWRFQWNFVAMNDAEQNRNCFVLLPSGVALNKAELWNDVVV